MPGDGEAPALRSGLSHFLGPAGISLACHLFLVVIMTFATWAVVRPDASEPFLAEYKAKIVTDSKKAGPSGGFHFPGRAYKDRPDSARASRESDTVQDLASLLDSDPAFKPAPIDPGGSGLGTLAVKELGRSDVVGIGSGGGLGKGGQGSGLGDRDLAGGGPVGTLWGGG